MGYNVYRAFPESDGQIYDKLGESAQFQAREDGVSDWELLSPIFFSQGGEMS